jgi:mannose-6-phosphate isomerase-like protein (cupin superfamily)
MTDERLLGGKVIKRTLPVVRPPVGEEEPDLKRLMLQQGELAQFWNGEEAIQYIAFIELLVGKPRGNHFHRKKREWVYMIRGEVRLRVEDVESREGGAMSLKVGDLVVISTGVAHVLEAVEPGMAIEFSAARFEVGDVERFVVS